MKASLILRNKDYFPEGSFIEMVVWQVPTPVPPTVHGYKYRLVYIHNGQRAIGFDNERGKGDHMHIGSVERPYAFTTVAQLVEDFIAQVERWRSA